jgi:hypothetical protein
VTPPPPLPSSPKVPIHMPNSTSDSLFLSYSQLHPPPSASRSLTLRRHIFTRASIIIMCHLQPRPLISTLNVEALICFAAIQNTLIAPHLLRDKVQCLNELQSQFLPLLIFRDGDIFDVSYETEVMDAVSNISKRSANRPADRLTISAPLTTPQFLQCVLHPQ